VAPGLQLLLLRLPRRAPVSNARSRPGLHSVSNALTALSSGLDFLFHMFFLARYCRLLEEGSFRGRSADFLWMLLFGAALLTCVAPFVPIQFLGSSLTFMMVYVWGRRNGAVHMSFLGLFTFSAPYLPWVLLACSWLLGSSPLVDALGIGAGHSYYFLADVYPRLTGRRPLATPALLRALLPPDDAMATPQPRRAAQQAEAEPQRRLDD
jgi:Derlin-2/3